jgi:hypothetical protein
MGFSKPHFLQPKSVLFLLFILFPIISSLNLQSLKDVSQTVNIPNTVSMLERLRTKLLELAGDTMMNDK